MGEGDHAAELAQERKCKENTACVPDAQRPECGMELVERVGCRVAGVPRPAYLKQPPAAHCCSLTMQLLNNAS